MSLGEILDGALILLRRRIGLFFGLSAVCLGLPTLLSFYTQQTARGENIGLALLGTLLNVLGYLLLHGASIYVVSETYLGRDPRLGQALGYAAEKMGRIFVAGLASGIVTFFAFLLLIVPGIIVACGYAVSVPVVVLEDLPSSTDALGRSWALTKGFKGKAFLLGLVMFALVLVVFVGAGIAIGMATALFKPMAVPGMILLALIMLMVYPFTSCVMTLFYYDLRVRKEGFDLELLNQQIGGAPSPA
jgi:uncharacterized membrane protein